MRAEARTFIAMLLTAQLLAGCGQRISARTGALPGENRARAAADKVAVLVKDVIPYAYDAGKPSQCAIIYDVFNNTSGKLDAATAQIGGYSFALSELPPHTEYSSDQTMTVAPAGGSCAGVVQALTLSRDSVSSSDCSMGGVSSPDCQSRLVGVMAIDAGTVDEIRQADAAAARQYAAQVLEAFNQAKAQGWARRGQYQAAAGGGFVLANPAAPVPLTAVMGPDFDPSKVSDAAAPATTNFTLCAPNPNDATDKTPGRLAVLSVARDTYGLANWYQLRLVCSGHPDHTIWMRAAAIERLLAAGQIVKQARP